MGLIELKKELAQQDKNQLIGLISELYKNNKTVKEYLDYCMNPDEQLLQKKYKDQVYEAFYPKRGYNLKLSIGKKAITEFKKLKPSPPLLVDLMLYYVETGVSFTNDFGDISESFYSSLESVYRQSLELMEKEHLLEHFKDRANKICNDVVHIGWGFYDTLSHYYTEFYG
jgi:hypothetical protein